MKFYLNYRGRPLDVIGAHVQGMNNCSIGVCAEGDYHNKDKTMPQAQYNAIVELCMYLKQNYYPNAKIVGHIEIGDSNCPGQYYPLEQIKNDINNKTVSIKPEKSEYEIDLDTLIAKGLIENRDIWSQFGAFVTKAQAITILDKATGGIWDSEEADVSVHWVQPHIISLCGKGVISDKEIWLNNPDAYISKAQTLALIDKISNGTRPEYINRPVDHWGRNHLDSLCDKNIISTPEAWCDDFEGTVIRGNFMALLVKTFNF